MSVLKSRFLVTTAVLLAGMGLASAQGVGGGAGGAASEKGMSAGGHSGGGMSGSMSGREGASHNEGMTQGRGAESRESGRAESPSASGCSSLFLRARPSMPGPAGRLALHAHPAASPV